MKSEDFRSWHSVVPGTEKTLCTRKENEYTICLSFFSRRKAVFLV